jgi:hypothetical protein
VGQAKREYERWEDLKSDVAGVAISTGALQLDEETDELVRVEDPSAERHAYARATILQKRGRLNGSLAEVREAIKEALDEGDSHPGHELPKRRGCLAR